MRSTSAFASSFAFAFKRSASEGAAGSVILKGIAERRPRAALGQPRMPHPPPCSCATRLASDSSPAARPLYRPEALSEAKSHFLQLVDDLVKEHERVISSIAKLPEAMVEPPAQANTSVSKPQAGLVVRDEVVAAEPFGKDEATAPEFEDAMGKTTSMASQSSQSAGLLWPCWEAPAEDVEDPKPLDSLDSDIDIPYHRSSTTFSRARTIESLGNQQRSWFISPNSQTRVIWDILGLVLLIYDLFRIPLLAFDPPKLVFLQVGDWISLSYWTLDIPASFLTGYYHKDGTVVTNLRKIRWRYFSTWLGPDLFVVAIDWMTSLMGATNTAGGQDSTIQAVGILRVGKIARVGRMLRLLRLARLAKLNSIIFLIQERVSSESTSILVGVIKNMLLLLALNHVFACLWFLIGSAERPGDEKSWVEVYQMKSAEFSEQYIVSLHWTLTQFTPAGMDVQPQNIDERVFNVGLIVIAMISFSTFVSSITSSMTRLRMIQEDDLSAAFILRKYLKENAVSRVLRSRIVRFIDLAKERHRKRLHPSKVELLKLLTGPLRVELQYEMYSPTLSVHSFFAEYGRSDRSALSELCFTAIHGLALSKGDHLFNLGARAQSMYFITSGTLHYEPTRRLHGALKPWTNLSVGKWACESALWMPWMHRGTMTTVVECDVLALDAVTFRDVTVARRKAFLRSKDHAMEFFEEMSRVQEVYGYYWDVPVHLILERSTLDIECDVTIAEELEAVLMQSVVSRRNNGSRHWPALGKLVHR